MYLIFVSSAYSLMGSSEDQVISLRSMCTEFLKNLRSELKVITTHYPIVEMI